MELQIFYSQIDEQKRNYIVNALKKAYGKKLRIKEGKDLPLLEKAYNARRKQYNAEILLNHLKSFKIALWVIDKDLYCLGMNFIFGYASYYGAILSLYRLDSRELIEKEAIHEVGHVLGLTHCRNECVMQFSNSLLEAEMKPSYLCKDCERKLSLLH